MENSGFFYDPHDDNKEHIDETEIPEEYVVRGSGPLLVLCRSCLTPKIPEDSWLHNSLFHSTCTINGKVYRFIIDLGSCENVIPDEFIRKLALTTEHHPAPYKLAWLKQGSKVQVSRWNLIPFSIGTTYRDKIYFDIVPMNACHLLLGRPWQYDRHVIHDDKANTYNFWFENKKITLIQSKEPPGALLPTASVYGPLKTQALLALSSKFVIFLTRSKFEVAMQEDGVVYVLVSSPSISEPAKTISLEVQSLLQEFIDVFPENLPDGLLPLRDIQHQLN